MKKVFVPITFLISISIIMFVIFTVATKDMMTEGKALEIGEEKYLKFLWMVDGVFNSEIMNEDFTVNGKRLKEEDRVFTCKYKNKNSEDCVANNFEKAFKDLFANDIKYDNVYGDGLTYTLYTYKDGKYIFHPLRNCSITRMDTSHKLEIVSISNDELVYKISFKDNLRDRIITKTFSLVLENDKWKINKAYYNDLCEMRYYIDTVLQ